MEIFSFLPKSTLDTEMQYSSKYGNLTKPPAILQVVETFADIDGIFSIYEIRSVLRKRQGITKTNNKPRRAERDRKTDKLNK